MLSSPEPRVVSRSFGGEDQSRRLSLRVLRFFFDGFTEEGRFSSPLRCLRRRSCEWPVVRTISYLVARRRPSVRSFLHVSYGG